MFCSPSARAQSPPALYFWGETLTLDRQGGRLEGQPQARMFWGDYQLLADQIVWDTASQRYLARGQVIFRSATLEVQAETLQVLLAQGQLIAQNASLRYLGRWQADAESLWLSEDVWALEQVGLRLRDSPLQLQARRLRLLPQSPEQTAQLEDIQVIGPGGLLSPVLPFLEWPLQPTPASAEIRNPVQQFQPQLGWQQGQLQAGLNAKLWQSPQQRLYLQSALGPDGPAGALSHEWRPQSDVLINSEIGLRQQGLQGHIEALAKTPWPAWFAGGLRWQEPDLFAQQFWLPELVQPLTPVSAVEILAHSEYLYWGPIQTRYMLGGRWTPTNQAQFGGSALANLPLYQDRHHEVWSSLLANGFYEQGLQATAGLRLLDRWQINPQWQAGAYLEQYISSWPAQRFLQSGRLTPWLGAFVRWQAHDDLALVLETALSLTTGQPVLADALLTWRVNPVYLNLMLRGLPLGLQLQVQFDDLGF